MIGLTNPWLLLGAVLVVLSSFGAGLKAGATWNEGKHLAALAEQQKLTDAETARANKVATIYGESLLTSQDTVSKLRKELSNARGKLATCTPDGGVRFTAAFVGLRNSALQAAATDTGKPADPPAGAGATPDDILDQDIENGRRWKACRLQLNALIDALVYDADNK